MSSGDMTDTGMGYMGMNDMTACRGRGCGRFGMGGCWCCWGGEQEIGVLRGGGVCACASLEERKGENKKGKEREGIKKLTSQRRHNLVHLTLASGFLKRRGRY